MKCLEIRSLFSRYLDNDLDDENKLIVKQHIEECAECARYFDELGHTIQLCNSLKPLALPNDFSLRLNEKLKIESPTIPPWYKNKKIYIGAAGLAASIMLITGPLYNSYLKSNVTFESSAPHYINDLPQVTTGADKDVPPPTSASPQKTDESREQTAPPANDSPRQSAATITQPQQQPIQPELPPQTEPSTPPLSEPIIIAEHKPVEDIDADTSQATAQPENSAQATVVEETAPSPSAEPPMQRKSMPETTVSPSATVMDNPVEPSNSGGGGGGNSMAMLAVPQVNSPTVLYMENGSNLSIFKEWLSKNIPSAKEVSLNGFGIISLSSTDFDISAQIAGDLKVNYRITNAEDASFSAIFSELTEEYYIIIAK